MDKLVWDAVSQVLWILILIVVLSALAFSLPFIFRKVFSRKNFCACGEKLKPTDTFCPKCGKKVEK